jgi:hypothetical protein
LLHESLFPFKENDQIVQLVVAVVSISADLSQGSGASSPAWKVPYLLRKAV